MNRKLVFVVVLLFSSTALAAESSEAPIETGGGEGGANISGKARGIVDAYKALRRQCAASMGDERVKCFSRLNQLNAEYQSAKRSLLGEAGASDTNLHTVSKLY